MIVKIKRLDKDLPLPKYAHEGDAGLDLYSRLDCILAPFDRIAVPTGIAVSIPEGYAGFIQPRSGLAAKHGITVLNTPGLIDSGYRGEIKVILINLDSENSFVVRRGDRIAQLVIQKVENVKVEVVEELDKTARSEKGFGSSGLN